MADHAERLQRLLEPERLYRAAGDLSVGAESLVALGIGWAPGDELARLGLHGLAGALSFPMRDADERVIGIRLRLASGRKLAVPGSKNGLFIATRLIDYIDRLLVSEGESDCAALLDLGFTAVGRPGCTSCARQLARLVHRVQPNAVIIVADNDAQGIRGANDLGRRLRINCADVRIIQPPEHLKDARDWKRAGATRDAIETSIAAACPVAISVRRSAGGR
jgi:DNA primase